MRYRFRYEERERLAVVRHYLEEHLDEPVRIEALCKLAVMSRAKLNAGFVKHYGTSVQACLKNLRMKKARELLLQTEESIRAIAAACGYAHQRNFSTEYKQYYGVVPLAERRDGETAIVHRES